MGLPGPLWPPRCGTQRPMCFPSSAHLQRPSRDLGSSALLLMEPSWLSLPPTFLLGTQFPCGTRSSGSRRLSVSCSCWGTGTCSSARARPVPLPRPQGGEWYQAPLRMLVRTWPSRCSPAPWETREGPAGPCPSAPRQQWQVVAVSGESKAARDGDGQDPVVAFVCPQANWRLQASPVAAMGTPGSVGVGGQNLWVKAELSTLPPRVSRPRARSVLRGSTRTPPPSSTARWRASRPPRLTRPLAPSCYFLKTNSESPQYIMGTVTAQYISV